jgi:hypothetical protein
VDASALLPVLHHAGDPDYVRFTFNRSDSAREDPGTRIEVEYGNHLTGWTTAVHDGDHVILSETAGSPTDAVEVKLKRSSLAPGGRIFVRLRASVTAP